MKIHLCHPASETHQTRAGSVLLAVGGEAKDYEAISVHLTAPSMCLGGMFNAVFRCCYREQLYPYTFGIPSRECYIASVSQTVSVAFLPCCRFSTMSIDRCKSERETLRTEVIVSQLFIVLAV